jgi:hypothetical protein
MNLKLDRIISIATLVAALIAIILVLKRPAPVAAPATSATAQQAQTSDQSAANAQREQSTPFSGPTTIGATTSGTTSATAPANSQLPAQANAKPEAGVNSDQVSSAIAKMLGGGGGGLANLSPDTNVGSGDPVIKDQQVTMDGDIVHGKFLTTIAGKDVWVTIAGHMGEKDGYATFDPTEFKVGDMEVPVSLVNPALQRKLAEERDRLKIPNSSN